MKAVLSFFSAVTLCGAGFSAALTADPQVVWRGVTLGAPAAGLRSLLGDPLRIVPFKNGARRIARYWIPGANSTYFLLTEERGYVLGFDAFTDAAPTGILDNVPPDPSGVRVGDTLESVKAKHPDFRENVDDDGSRSLQGPISSNVGALYTFSGDRLQGFYWGTPPSGALPELSPIVGPAGDSQLSAILDLQDNETDGTAWEYRYLAFHPCAGDARWQLQRQELISGSGRAYDRLHVVCPTTKEERDFYFDITSYFGKL